MNNSSLEIRLIRNTDTAEVLEIYRHYVLNTHITFEYEVPTLEEFSNKIEHILLEYPWLVCCYNDGVVGYAYGSRHRAKTAYQWSPEATIYMRPEFQGRGVGRVLYDALFELLRLQGYFNVYAGVALPNEGSERLHRATGFDELGVFKKIGYKLGKWHDTKWFHLALAEHIDEPPAPKLLNEVVGDQEFIKVIASANEKLNSINR